MLQLRNHTPFAAAIAVFPNPAGIECVYLTVKASFRLGPQGPELLPKPVPLLAADVYWGDPAASGLRAAADFTLTKPATDIMLLGHAVAPRPVRVLDVGLRVGPVARTLRVFGERRWEGAGDGARISAPEPFERLPLRWELAFGGIAPADEGKPPESEPRNPVGRGLLAGPTLRNPDGRPLPNIEDPRALIARPQDRPPPAGVAPVAPAWLPRRTYAGTYDAAWQATRAPYLPLDFDPRFLNVAAPELVAPDYLQGGEPVELSGVTAEAPLRFNLPACTLATVFHFAGREIPQPAALDTVVLEPDLARLQLVWRACQPVDKHALRLTEVHVRCAEYGRGGEG